MTPVIDGTAVRRDDDEMLAVASPVLGPLEIAPADVRTFPHGLLGFPECRRFALLAIDGRGGMYWLQSIEHPALAFLLVDPFRLVDDYVVEISDLDRHELAADDPAEVLVLAILTLPERPGAPCTANLQGPVAVNLRTGVGRQLVLADARNGVRTPVDLARLAG